MINEKRKENNLNELPLVFVDMIIAKVNEDTTEQFSNKMSSTLIREYLNN
jgi:phosphopantetheine adenylyltransferase